ncbi:MAG: ATP-binding protein, partial [Gammaproteobacteria bacterium]|nr:ATP-binding protein [Gammaproteobacteria bacterium]
ITTGINNDSVFIEISDTGKGIPEEALNRIFDPFYTSKPVGEGTGLGLSLSYSIIEKHKGRIDVDSTVGAGTKFTIWLPVKQNSNDDKYTD